VLEPVGPDSKSEMQEAANNGSVEQATEKQVTGAETLEQVLELIATTLEHPRLHAAGTALATELASDLSCERVSLAFLEGRQVRVVAISHSARFDERTKLVRDIARAMEEAVDQEAILAHPPLDDGPPQPCPAHEALCREHGSGAVCTVPLSEDTGVIGALTLEAPAGQTLDPGRIAVAEHALAFAAPILQAKRREDRWIGRKVRDAAWEGTRELFGPDHPGAKLVAAVAGVLLLLLMIVPGTYRISAPAKLEGTVQRVIVAPIDGYVAESRARAGDLVGRGEILGVLDDADLRLERRKWYGKRAQIVKEHRAALAEHDRAQVSILRAQADQAEAEIALLDEQLARTQLVAPFDGIVVKGDLSQSLGSPVERGQVLFEVAPLASYRIIVEVDERSISDVSTGQTGRLTLSALPGQSFPLTVERITPVSTSEEGRNFFRVEGRLEAPSILLRPGMEGLAKIRVGRSSLLWIWTHRLVDWLRLWAWSWLP
jgi:RND family efflux transporter MFP subunit